MKILMQNRKDAFTVKGGDTVAMLGLKKYLEKLGIEVDISLELSPDLSKYDWILIFNILRTLESYAQFRNAKKQRKKIALMPIYWDKKEFESYGRNFKLKLVNKLFSYSRAEFIKNIIRALKDKKSIKGIKYQFFKSYFRQQKEMVKKSEVILPNSYQEKELLEKEFGSFNGETIYNGIDPEIFKEGNPQEFKEKYKINFEKFGLCVARFDERKNQLSVIKAINEINIPIIFIGSPSPNHKNYFNLCQKIANKEIIKFLPFLPQEELKNAYSSAHFHVLASWFETPGLVNLEAGIYNCNLVISERGPVREYFDNLVWYCSPNDLNSIQKAIKEAYNKDRGYYNIRERILKNFTWEKSALKLKEVLENF